MTLNEIIGAILSIGGMSFLIYIFFKIRKMEKERQKRLRELKEIYSK